MAPSPHAIGQAAFSAVNRQQFYQLVGFRSASTCTEAADEPTFNADDSSVVAQLLPATALTCLSGGQRARRSGNCRARSIWDCPGSVALPHFA